MDFVYRHPVAPMAEVKTRTVSISKSDLYKDIDALTYKYGEVSSIESPKLGDLISSDSDESLDGHILARNLEYRDAKLRQLMQFALIESEERLEEISALEEGGETFRYTLEVPMELKDAVLDSLQVLIHRYLVYGVLFDWYSAGMGAKQSGVYESQLITLETDIINGLRARCVAKRPLQPFGPAGRIGRIGRI